MNVVTVLDREVTQVSSITSKLFCRLCASPVQCNNDEVCLGANGNGWFNLTRDCGVFRGGTVTVASILKEIIPKDILFSLPNDQLPDWVCYDCFGELRRLVQFLDKIRECQLRLKEEFKDIYIPKKRGRPKKSSKTSLPTEIPHSPSADKETVADKRVTRPNTRYATKQTGDNENPLFNPKSTEDPEKVKVTNFQTEAKQDHRFEEETIPDQLVHSKSRGEGIDTDDEENGDKESKQDPDPNFTRSLRKFHIKGKRRTRPFARTHSAFKCDVCDKMYTSNASLLYHKVASHQTKDFQCDICSKTFSHRSILANHMFTHSSEKNFRCQICDAKFQTKSKLATHVGKVHSVHSESRTYVCDKCGMSFKTRSVLKSHEKIHSENKPFKCEYCHKEFGRRSNMVEHVRIHTKDKPFNCNYPGCNKNFTTGSQLRTHKFSHSTTKEILCSVCGRGFNNHATLRYHMNRHNGEKSQECHICKKKFVDKRSLELHLNIHTGEKPYQCDVCLKNFRDKSNLKKHRNLHGRDIAKANGRSSTSKESSNSFIADKFKSNNEATSLDATTLKTGSSLKATTGENMSTSETVIEITKEPVTELEELSQNPSSETGSENIFLYHLNQLQPDVLLSVEEEHHANELAI